MRTNRKYGIRRHITWLTLAPLLVMAISLEGFFLYDRAINLDHDLLTRGQLIARQLAASSEYGVFSNNQAFLNGLAKNVLQQPDVSAVIILNESSRVIASSGEMPGTLPIKTGEDTGANPGKAMQNSDQLLALVNRDVAIYNRGDTLLLYQPILQTQVALDEFDAKSTARQVGAVIIEMSWLQTRALKSRLLWLTLLATVAFLLLVVYLVHLASRGIIETITKMSVVIHAIADGALETRITTPSSIDELCALTNGVNQMAEDLLHERSILQQRIDQATRQLRDACDAAVSAREVAESASRQLALQNAQLKNMNMELESAQISLRINKTRLHAILDNSPIGIWMVGVEGKYHFVNKTFCNAIGVPESKFLTAHHLTEVMDPDAAASCLKSDCECLAQDEPHLSLEPLTFVDGKQHFVQITKVKLRDDTGGIIGIIGTALDITEQRAREAELAASRVRLREVEHRQLVATERQRLMQDMHDGLGSSLVSALRVVELGRMDEAEVVEVLRGCIDDLNLAIDSMEPMESDLLLLLATLRYRLEPRLESTGIALRWEVQDVPSLDWLAPKHALHILRILQEAFTNIIKHTRASKIRVSTASKDDYVTVTITDNGQGFAAENALRGSGKGLSNQVRRAQAIDAEVAWDSSDEGTCFTLRLPIKQRPINV